MKKTFKPAYTFEDLQKINVKLINDLILIINEKFGQVYSNENKKIKNQKNGEF